ncbi:hypothetical protein EII25_02065 [Erysipelotrichaceae bacterium OH741_COT-311]|nr:hypothetical protein EII25_02065 [Erysipelotrichaceae bacterium OH741_COT-311]
MKKEIYSEGWYQRYEIEEYVDYYNNIRVAYALNYKSPIRFKTELGYQ